MTNITHLSRSYLFSLLEEHIRKGHYYDDIYHKLQTFGNLTGKHKKTDVTMENLSKYYEKLGFYDPYFVRTRKYLRKRPQQKAKLTDVELQKIKDDIRSGLQHYQISEMMGVSPKNQAWYTELLVELYTCKFTGKPPYSKPVVTIETTTKADAEKFWDTFVSCREDHNAPCAEHYQLKIGGVIAIDWDINLCHNWGDDYYRDVVDAEPDFPVMTFDIENNAIVERYPYGPTVDFDLLERQLKDAGINYKLIKH